MKIIKCSYEIVDVNIDDSDACERGDEGEFVIETDAYDLEWGITASDLAVKYLREQGVMQASSDPTWSPGTWYSTPPRINENGPGEKSNHYFLEGFTDEEEEQIHKELKSKRVI